MDNHIIILGCGASAGVPLIGCQCKVCQSGNPKNKRTRVSLYVQIDGIRFLIDTSPDLRQQCLSNNIRSVDAILYTHAHADHVHGIDDTRPFNHHNNAPIPIYTDINTYQEIETRFPFAFKEPIPEYGWFRPCLQPNIIKRDDQFAIQGLDIRSFKQMHGQGTTLGFRFGNIAYSTDVNAFPETSEKHLYDLDLWIVDCLRYEKAPTHAHLDLTLEWITKYKPKRAILTHMSHDFEYDKLMQALPENVEPAYDGMQIAL
jgi:phosphoribosyl 1,2-cyclic phosphate phosphodiesterase